MVTVANTGKVTPGTLLNITDINAEKGGLYNLSVVGVGQPNVALTVDKNTNTPTASGEATTYMGQIDWRYYDCGLKIVFDPQASIEKQGDDPLNFTGNAIFSFFNMSNIHITGGTFIGQKKDLASAAPDGDDGVRVNSCRRVVIENCYFRDFGDSAFRANTWTRDPMAMLPPVGGNPPTSTAGIQTESIIIKGNYFYNIHQISTTTDDYLHGGASNYWLENNIFDHVRGSVKFATRTPGANKLFLLNNTIKSSLDKGFEIDSYGNILISGNRISKTTSYAIFMVSNNSTGSAGSNLGYGFDVLGFPYDGMKIINNYFDDCASSSGARNGIIRFQPDTYTYPTTAPYRFTYQNVEIRGNNFVNISNTSSYGIHFLDGSYQDLVISDNNFPNYPAHNPIRLELRSDTAGLKSRIRIENNNIEMNLAGTPSFPDGTAIFLKANSGNEPIDTVMVKNNMITGNKCKLLFGFYQCKNLTIADNRADYTTAGLSGCFIFDGHENNEVSIYNNQIITDIASSTGWNFYNSTGLILTGLYMYNNIIQTASSSTAISLANSVANAWCLNNRVIDGTVNYRQVPVNTRELGVLGRREVSSATPAAGTWRVGDIVDFNNAAPSGAPGCYCTTSGTLGTLSSVTATTTNGSTSVSVNSSASLAVGIFIEIAGLTGVRTITAINSSTNITVSPAATVTISTPAAVSYKSPLFKNMAVLAS